MSSEPIDRSNILNINVGILGHVDAGKTALVRSLSTSLSTAALDKNPQSQQRGITLDLGFSAFTLPMPSHLASDPSLQGYDSIQFTLVDCPGHASLIRTIIGGAQIIDMVLLVVDANKGIQTQTAECIVIGEITTDNMVVVLNKVDTIPEEEREAKIERVSNRIRKVFASTKFSGVPIVPTAAAVGGEKSTASAASGSVGKSATFGIDSLVDLIKTKVQVPARNYTAPFYYAIDHCFSIKGHGTVLTGTVLSGSVSANSIIELPQLHLQRKVKSLQMFRKPVKAARQGDRVGICVTNLDAGLIERGIAAAPGTVPLLHSALCVVKKVRFFRGACKSMTKFHITIGHSTVIASAVFFGTKQFSSYLAQSTGSGDAEAGEKAASTASAITSATTKQSALNSTYQRSFPDVAYKFYNPTGALTWSEKTAATAPTEAAAEEAVHYGYEYQDEMLSAEGLSYGGEPVQWVLLQFQQPVLCPIGSLVIGSRLDADTSDREGGAGGSAAASAAQSCRLAFYGPVKASLSGEAELPRTGVYTWRTKECEVFLVTDALKSGVCREVVIWKLASGGGQATPFLGLRVETPDKRSVGTIVSSYGADGKCRVKFPEGVRLTVGSKLLFRYKRYVFDKSKRMVQTGLDELRATEDIAPESDWLVEALSLQEQQDAEAVVARQLGKKGKPGKTSKAEKAANSAAESSSSEEPVKEATAVVVEEVKVAEVTTPTVPAQAPTPTSQTPLVLPSSHVPITTAAAVSPTGVGAACAQGEVRVGIIESVKTEEPCPENAQAQALVAIVRGAFRMEENVRLFAGARVVCGSATGQVVGPFGKMGKCKVRFPTTTAADVVLERAVDIYLSADK